MKNDLILIAVLPLLLLLLLTACDSDSNSNAQDMSDPDACPCFSAGDIMNDAMGKTFDGCSFAPNLFNLTISLFEDNNPFLVLVQCSDVEFESQNCFCADTVRSVEMTGLTKEQFLDCRGILTDAIVNEFGEESMEMCLISNVN